jgi:hypothetical protein
MLKNEKFEEGGFLSTVINISGLNTSSTVEIHENNI